jgi:hypothetical protein
MGRCGGASRGTSPPQRAGADRSRRGLRRFVEDQHGELIAAEAGDGVGVVDQPAQPLSHLIEEQVAGMVAQRVVDALETVQIQHQ